jgi:ribosomal protein S18 acetylase RimI-like enzyme
LIRIIEVQVEQMPLLQKLAMETFEESFGAFNTEADMASYLKKQFSSEQLHREFNDATSRFYFICEMDRMAGYIKTKLEKAGSNEKSEPVRMEIERFYILKEWQNRGFGSIVLKELQSLAEKDNITQIFLGVWEHNTAAQRFYTRHGFERVGEHIFQLGDDAQTDFILCKELKTSS